MHTRILVQAFRKTLSLLLTAGLVLGLVSPAQARAGITLFYDDFEQGFANWTPSGLWHMELQSSACGSRAAPFPSPATGAYYGIPGECTYTSGSPNSGDLTLSQPVVLPPAALGHVTFLSFWTYESVRLAPVLDQRLVQVSTDGGQTWTELGRANSQGKWRRRLLNLTPYMGQSILIRFQFDSVAHPSAGHFGWMIDDVQILTNAAPEGVDDAYETGEDGLLHVAAPGVLANDLPANPGDVLIVSGSDSLSAYGASVAVFPDGSFAYDPSLSAIIQALPPNQFLIDTFTYVVRDPWGASDQATVNITVSGANDLPVALDDLATIDEDTPFVQGASGVLANDSDLDRGDALQVVGFDARSLFGATVSVATDGSYTYDPSASPSLQSLAAGETRLDSFRYTISDSYGGRASATVSMVVLGVNDPPVAVDDKLTLPDNSGPVAIDVLANDSSGPEPDEVLSIVAVSQPDQGTTIFSSSLVTYTPALDFTGRDAFTYTISDGNDGRATGRVVIEVIAADQFLVVDAGPDMATAEGTQLTFSGNLLAPGLASQIHWDFGDGTTASGTLSPTHTYLDNGLYTARLSVTGANGATGEDSLVVTVANVAPSVKVGANIRIPTKTSANFNGSFTDPGTLDQHTITWDFGDGNTGTGSLTPTHSYPAAGVYKVTLTVTDDDGGLGKDTLTLTAGLAESTIFMPLLSRPGKPDLVGSFTVSPNGPNYQVGDPVLITVVVKNQGSNWASGFWVDFFINPSQRPAPSGQTWNKLCTLSPCYGIAWFVEQPLHPGESVTLTSTPGSYSIPYTYWPGSFAAGTSDLYLLVDSWNPNTSTGAIPESDESNNLAELHGLVVTSASLTGEVQFPMLEPILPDRR